MDDSIRMRPHHWLAAAVAICLFLAGLSVVWAGDDVRGKRGPGVAPVTFALYKEECGACHFPYQPGLLPAKSWEKVMDGLADHFGDNAELPPEDEQAIRDYLRVNGADRSSYRRSVAISRSLRGKSPLRITEVRYFRHEHNEIPKRLVAENPEVGSISRCEACHLRAEEGYYNERSVNIPGHGRWDD